MKHLTRETLICLHSNKELLEKVRDYVRLVAVTSYLNSAHRDGFSEPVTVVCPTCGEFTQYSTQLEDCSYLDKLCLSDQCVEMALLEIEAAEHP